MSIMNPFESRSRRLPYAAGDDFSIYNKNQSSDIHDLFQNLLGGRREAPKLKELDQVLLKRSFTLLKDAIQDRESSFLEEMVDFLKRYKEEGYSEIFSDPDCVQLLCRDTNYFWVDPVLEILPEKASDIEECISKHLLEDPGLRKLALERPNWAESLKAHHGGKYTPLLFVMKCIQDPRFKLLMSDRLTPDQIQFYFSRFPVWYLHEALYQGDRMFVPDITVPIFDDFFQVSQQPFFQTSDGISLIQEDINSLSPEQLMVIAQQKRFLPLITRLLIGIEPQMRYIVPFLDRDDFYTLIANIPVMHHHLVLRHAISKQKELYSITQDLDYKHSLIGVDPNTIIGRLQTQHEMQKYELALKQIIACFPDPPRQFLEIQGKLSEEKELLKIAPLTDLEESPPDEFICSISQELMENPVRIEGETGAYEEASLNT
ncbi:MAG: hypothetical protein ACOYK9_06835, partial [Chlamydiia bacterium]